MIYKNKNTHKHFIAGHVGLILIATAAAISTVVAPVPSASDSDKKHKDKDHSSAHMPHHHRREGEEAGPHYISYNITQVTPARSVNF